MSGRFLYSRAMLAMICFLFFSGCGPDPLTKKQMAQLAEGRNLYEVHCAHCHRDNDLALKKVPPDLHGLFNKSTLPSGAPATDAEVVSVIRNGRGMMPGFYGRFDQQQMAALVSYLHTGLR